MGKFELCILRKGKVKMCQTFLLNGSLDCDFCNNTAVDIMQSQTFAQNSSENNLEILWGFHPIVVMQEEPEINQTFDHKR